MAGWSQFPLIENQISAASAIERCLPAVVVHLVEEIQRILPQTIKLLGTEHVVELGFNLRFQTESVNLQIAGIRGCTVPGVHYGIPKMALQEASHLFPGTKVHRF